MNIIKLEWDYKGLEQFEHGSQQDWNQTLMAKFNQAAIDGAIYENIIECPLKFIPIIESLGYYENGKILGMYKYKIVFTSAHDDVIRINNTEIKILNYGMDS